MAVSFLSIVSINSSIMSKRCSLFNFTLIIGFFWLLLLAFFHSSTLENLKDSDYEFEGSDIVKNLKIVDKIPERFLNLNKIVKFQPTKKKKLKKPQREVFAWPKLSDETLKLHELLNLKNPGQMGEPVILPENLSLDIQQKINQSYEIYKINEFVSSLIPLDRDLPDIRPDYCKTVTYSENLPQVSVIMVFHNEPLSLILRSVFAVFKRTSEKLLKEIVLVDDRSTHGKT